jgi:hypothetical protein
MYYFLLNFFVLNLVCIYQFSCIAQNLVPNPSFESLKKAPCQLITSPALFSEHLHDWTLPSNGTADIFCTTIDPTCWVYPFGDSYFDMKIGTTSVGVQTPRTGNSMVGMAVYLPESEYREYLQVRLLMPLEVGRFYKVSFWVAHASAVHFATNELGFVLLKDSLQVNHAKVIKIKPDFVNQAILTTKFLEWKEVSTIIEAKEAAQYLVIGNFTANKKLNIQWIEKPLHIAKEEYLSQSAYYFIDDVAVYEYEEDEFAGFRQRKRLQLDSIVLPKK